MYAFDFTDDATVFRDRAQSFLSTHPVTTSVVATTVARAIGEAEQGIERDPDRPWWFTTIHDRDTDDDHGRPGSPGRPGSGPVIGIAMRTAPSDQPPIWINEMPDDAAIQLARVLRDRGEFIPGVNGALPAARLFAEEVARLWSRRPAIGMHTRLFELGDLTPPAEVSGRLRQAVDTEAELLFGWRSIFHQEAAEQAGRDPSEEPFEVDLEDTRRRINAGNLWVWEDNDQVVHFSGASDPAFGVSRIGPVFTPREYRGRGYAAAAVSAVCGRLVDQGIRVCLFTDQGNPVSNELYQRIGFRPVVDMANFTIGRPEADLSGPASSAADSRHG